MKFTIETLNDNGSGMKYSTKDEFLKEVSLMIDDCIANGGTFFDAQINSDASCFFKDEEQESGVRLKAVDIEWETDGADVELPSEILIPKGITDEDEISDYISNETGFCHRGFYLEQITDPSDADGFEDEDEA